MKTFKKERLEAELMIDPDTNEWGMIILLNTKSEVVAENRMKKFLSDYNAMTISKLKSDKKK